VTNANVNPQQNMKRMSEIKMLNKNSHSQMSQIISNTNNNSRLEIRAGSSEKPVR
jgi:hypothetical protein